MLLLDHGDSAAATGDDYLICGCQRTDGFNLYDVDRLGAAVSADWFANVTDSAAFPAAVVAVWAAAVAVDALSDADPAACCAAEPDLLAASAAVLAVSADWLADSAERAAFAADCAAFAACWVAVVVDSAASVALFAA